MQADHQDFLALSIADLLVQTRSKQKILLYISLIVILSQRIVVLFIRSCFSEDIVRFYRWAVGMMISDMFSHYIIINNYLNLFTLGLICVLLVCM
uniref:Uncharacterized protein n=1 Tax=Strigamia maritima TaxID=126957 RepID=T1JIH1_STRMM